jgi:phosphoglycerate dehydrogenase-like enzyme
MKGKVIVNVGRGELINQKSLYENLKNGTLKGAAIDCWYNYPKNGETNGFPSDFPIYDLSNVVLSPHVAGYTSSASKENIREAFENLRSYLINDRTISEVDLDFGY